MASGVTSDAHNSPPRDNPDGDVDQLADRVGAVSIEGPHAQQPGEHAVSPPLDARAAPYDPHAQQQQQQAAARESAAYDQRGPPPADQGPQDHPRGGGEGDRAYRYDDRDARGPPRGYDDRYGPPRGGGGGGGGGDDSLAYGRDPRDQGRESTFPPARRDPAAQGERSSDSLENHFARQNSADGPLPRTRHDIPPERRDVVGGGGGPGADYGYANQQQRQGGGGYYDQGGRRPDEGGYGRPPQEGGVDQRRPPPDSYGGGGGYDVQRRSPGGGGGYDGQDRQGGGGYGSSPQQGNSGGGWGQQQQQQQQRGVSDAYGPPQGGGGGGGQGNWGQNRGGYGQNQGDRAQGRGGYGQNQGGYGQNRGGYGHNQGSHGGGNQWGQNDQRPQQNNSWGNPQSNRSDDRGRGGGGWGSQPSRNDPRSRGGGGGMSGLGDPYRRGGGGGQRAPAAAVDWNSGGVSGWDTSGSSYPSRQQPPPQQQSEPPRRDNQQQQPPPNAGDWQPRGSQQPPLSGGGRGSERESAPPRNDGPPQGRTPPRNDGPLQGRAPPRNDGPPQGQGPPPRNDGPAAQGAPEEIPDEAPEKIERKNNGERSREEIELEKSFFAEQEEVRENVFRSKATFEELLTPRDAPPRMQERGVQLLKAVYEMRYDRPSRVQAATLPEMLRGRNIIGQAQHGSGKTAAFSLAILYQCDDAVREVQAMVVCPTRELAVQSERVMKELAQFTQYRVFLGVKQQAGQPYDNSQVQAHIVIGTPGTLLGILRYRRIDPSTIRVFCFDEADVLIDTRNDRRGPPRRQGGRQSDSLAQQALNLRRQMGPRCQILLFSATYPAPVQKFAMDAAGRDCARVTIPTEELGVLNIRQILVRCMGPQQKFQMLLEVYNRVEDIGQSIIYVSTVATAKELTKLLREDEFECSVLFGKGMSPDQRDAVMKDFRDHKTSVLVTTNVLARGIDIEAVSMVVNYEVPLTFDPNTRLQNPDPETYIHRIGRAGRFGRKGVTLNLSGSEQEANDYRLITNHYNIRMPEFSPAQAGDIEMAMKEQLRKR